MDPFENSLGLQCVRCGLITEDPWQWNCPTCGPDARMDVLYPESPGADIPPKSQPFTIERYRDLLPLSGEAQLPALAVGGTPVIESLRFAEELGVQRVVIKDDGRNPSGSLKDRASAVAVAIAAATGYREIACASTGNAASSMACMAAAAGLRATVFVPSRAPRGKLAQMLAYGARVIRVDASYDETWQLCRDLVAEQGWFDRSCAVNPYLVEGKKTAGLEIAEQLGEEITDWVAVSAGDGCTIAGIGKGLREAYEAGWIPRVPKLLGVQAAGAQPLVLAQTKGRSPVAAHPQTIADSVCVGVPRNPDKALREVRAASGGWIAVADESIIHAQGVMARESGVFGEPAAAAAAAGVAEAVRKGLIGSNESVVIVNTGSGLKDPDTALQGEGDVIDVPPSIKEARALLNLEAKV